MARRPRSRTGDRGRAAVAAVADRGHARGEALRGAEPRDVDVLLPADPRLALDVQRDPLREVAEPVAEASVDRVLEVRVRVHEARDDHRVLVVRAFAELLGRTDRGDASVLDRRPRRPRSAGLRPAGPSRRKGRGSRVGKASRFGPRRPAFHQYREPDRHFVQQRSAGSSRASSSPGRCPGSSTAITATMK